MSVVGNPNTGLEDDVAATKRGLDRKKNQSVSWTLLWGAIITIAGNSPNVVGLVYIGTFAPGEGESLGQLLSGYADDPKSGILPPADGFAW